MKENAKLYSGIVVLVILIIIGGISLATKHSRENANNKKIKYVAKKDKTKDWVYDAPYKREVSIASYTINGKEYSATDFVAPYINVDSKVADAVNYSIQYKFNEAISTYNAGADGGRSFVDRFDYEYYVNKTVLSVIIYYVSGNNGISYPYYLAYNFDLTEGSELSFSEVYKIAGFTEDTLEDRVAEKISEKIDEKMANITNDSPELRKKNSLANYKASIKDGLAKCFLSENNTLNVIVPLNLPQSSNSFDEVLTIK